MRRRKRRKNQRRKKRWRSTVTKRWKWRCKTESRPLSKFKKHLNYKKKYKTKTYPLRLSSQWSKQRHSKPK